VIVGYHFRIIYYISLAFLVGINSPVFGHTEISPQDANDLIDTNDQLIIVDVREESEYCDSRGHIPGALNYPWTSDVLEV
jgi:3-mercaptopyruvate sulfurtransferase SseA